MGETQEFRGRWGQPQPATQEFGKYWPQVAGQDLAAGRWGQPSPMQFGGKIPFIDQGWRSPRMPFPSGGSRYVH